MQVKVITEMHYVKRFVISASPVEMLTVERALRRFAENEEEHETDRERAKRMINDIQEFEEVEEHEA